MYLISLNDVARQLSILLQGDKTNSLDIPITFRILFKALLADVFEANRLYKSHITLIYHSCLRYNILLDYSIVQETLIK